MTRFQCDLTPIRWGRLGQHHLSNGVAAITPGVNDMASQNIAELQQLKKFVKKIDAAKMRQARMITGDLQVSRRSSHSEPYLTKSEVRLRVAKMLKVQINTGSAALLEPKNAPDPGIRARLLALVRVPELPSQPIGLRDLNDSRTDRAGLSERSELFAWSSASLDCAATRAKARNSYTQRFRGFENPLPRTKVRGWHNGLSRPSAQG